MYRNLLFVVSILSLVSCNKDVSREVVLAETSAGQPFYFLPIEDDTTDVTISIAWPTKWIYESGNNTAVPFVAAETILSGGTATLAAQDVIELFNDKNASGRLSVTPDYVFGELNFPIEHIDDVISIASEMLTSPQFDQSWIKRIEQQISDGQKQLYSQTINKMWSASRVAILDDGPLNEFLSLSNLELVDAVQEDDIQRWHKETIVKSNLTIAVAGAISQSDAEKSVDQLVSSLSEGQAIVAPESQPNFKSRAILLHLPDAEKSTLGIIGQLPPTSDGGELTDLLAVHLFAQPESGPLFDAVRTKLRASYGLSAGYSNYDQATRVLIIGGEVETSKLAETSDIIISTYESYRTDPDLAGLENLRQSMAESTSNNITRANGAARTMLGLALDKHDPSDVLSIGETIDGIQAKDIQERLASVYPEGKDLIVVAATPDADALPGACVVTEISQAAQCP